MTARKMTLEEKVLNGVFDLSKASGDMRVELEIDHIGATLHVTDRQMRTVCQQLMQGNFLKKCGSTAVALTDHGQRYLEEHFDRSEQE